MRAKAGAEARLDDEAPPRVLGGEDPARCRTIAAGNSRPLGAACEEDTSRLREASARTSDADLGSDHPRAFGEHAHLLEGVDRRLRKLVWASDPLTPERPFRGKGVATDTRGVRRWQVVLLALLVVMATAIFIVVKFFEFVGSQN